MLLSFLSNAFNDPSDPWYYVVGVIFLLLIFGAVGLYMYLVGKKNKNSAEPDKTDAQHEPNKAEVKTDEQAPENTDAVADRQEQEKE